MEQRRPPSTGPQDELNAEYLQNNVMTEGAWDEVDSEKSPNLQNEARREQDLSDLTAVLPLQPQQEQYDAEYAAGTSNVPSLQTLAMASLSAKHDALTEAEDAAYDDNYPENQLSKGEYKEDALAPSSDDEYEPSSDDLDDID